MSEVVKDRTNDKKFSFNLIGISNRPFNLAPADKFLSKHPDRFEAPVRLNP